MSFSTSRASVAIALTGLLTLAVAACGSSDQTTADSSTAPAASSFPTPAGSLSKLISDNQASADLVVSPATSVFTVGENRFGFAVFTLDRDQITDADVAIYAEHGATGKVEGPFPGKVESLATEPAFTAQTTSSDPDAAKAVYVANLRLDKPGEWRLAALVKRDGNTEAVRMPSIVVNTHDPIPQVGDKAPVIHTPTKDDVGNISQIDTRVPPDDMHDVDFADVIGKQPIVLEFATPALCQSRVCGPVVDVAEQVKRDNPGSAAFIHMEIYNQNDPNKGLRPQVRAYHLQTEPWTFVIDKNGVISSRIEGALGVDELQAALDKVASPS